MYLFHSILSVLLDESTRKQNLAQPAGSEAGSLHPGTGIVAFLGLMTIHYRLRGEEGFGVHESLPRGPALVC